MIRALGFDGDDTLWHNESIFAMTQARFRDLLAKYVGEEELERRLLDVEMANLALFGYGIKGFILSVIEAAIEVSHGRVTTSEIQSIIDAGKEMLQHPVELLAGVPTVVEEMRREYRVLLITKGDLLDQESKIARSGLADLFAGIEVVSEKDVRTYDRILHRYSIEPAEFAMIGNSLKSDALPVASLGGWAVVIPYHLLWAHERAEMDPVLEHRITHLESMTQLPDLLMRWPTRTG